MELILKNKYYYDAKEYFPYENPRQDQIEATVDILTAFKENNYKYAILDAGTGFGKSAVARTLVELYADEYELKSFILTNTKQLQHQYAKETRNNHFDVDYVVGLGRSNFACRHSLNPETEEYNFTCDNGDCQRAKRNDEFECIYGTVDGYPPINGGCFYWKNKGECMLSDVALINYNVLLSDNQFVNHYSKRDLMICDEAHNIENKIMDEVCIDLTETTLKRDIDLKFKNEDFKKLNLEYWIEEIEKIIEKYENNLKDYGDEMNNKQFNHFDRTRKNLTYRKREIETNPELWVVCPSKPNERFRNIKFKPIHIRDYTEPYLLKSGDVRLFMSGSFIDPEQFCRDLGINPEEVYYRKAESIFNTKENNSIQIDYAGKLSRNYRERTLPKTIPILEKIFKKHSQEKGLIHCNSQLFANYIMNNIHNNRLMTYDSHSRDPNERIDAKLKEFKESKEPKIMASYSMNEGVDLPYDECRFQIIFKIPFPYLGDNQIRARKRIDNNWYNVKTVQKFIQAVGRGMRAEDDYCTNYVIDKDFDMLLYGPAFKKILPENIRESIIKK